MKRRGRFTYTALVVKKRNNFVHIPKVTLNVPSPINCWIDQSGKATCTDKGVSARHGDWNILQGITTGRFGEAPSLEELLQPGLAPPLACHLASGYRLLLAEPEQGW